MKAMKGENLKMDLAKSQKIVKIVGILDIIAAVLCLIGAIGMFGLTGAAAMNAPNIDLDPQSLGIGIASFVLVGIFMLIGGVVDLLEGIFAIRASNDAKKVGPLWVLAIIGLILSLISLITSITQGQQVGSNVLSLVINVVMFYLANNIKKLSKD